MDNPKYYEGRIDGAAVAKSTFGNEVLAPNDNLLDEIAEYLSRNPELTPAQIETIKAAGEGTTELRKG